MKRYFLLALTLVFFTPNLFAAAGVTTKEINYEANGVKLKGFLATPANVKGKVPGVLVVHEWWGHNAYARKRATMLAELGYVAFALDMYGEDKHATDPKTAGMYMTETLKSGQIKPRFEAALKILQEDPNVDATKLAAIGYCFGGGVVISMAEANEPLKGVVSFHGAFPPKTELAPGSVKPKLLVLHGGADQFAKPEEITQFKADMDHAKADYKFIVYPGAKHGFTDPEATAKGEMHHIPIGYDASADAKSWSEMKAFFKRILY